MTGRSDTERFLDAFLAPEGADQLSDRVLQAALSDVARTPQRRALRVPWRFTNMPLFARAAAAALALVVLAGGIVYLGSGGLIGGPNPTATPSPTAQPTPSRPPSPPPLTQRFDSTFNGISMNYPSGWQTSWATEPWTDKGVTFGDSDVDFIFDPEFREGLYFAVASEALRGRSYDTWSSDIYLRDLCVGPRPGYSGGSWGLDGASGWISYCGGSSLLTVATDTRGYVIVLHVGDEGLVDTYGSAWFQSVLETVDLRPEEALDASPSPSP